MAIPVNTGVFLRVRTAMTKELIGNYLLHGGFRSGEALITNDLAKIGLVFVVPLLGFASIQTNT